MAAQDNSGTPIPTPTPTSVIASEFIRAYYNALSNEPSALYAFYEDDSKFSRFEEGQVTDATPAQGQLAIHEAVQSIPYAGCKVRIETTDSHDSAFGCVIVIVTGIIVLVGQPPRTFVQTFLLQPLVSGSPHFYVRNDILRYTSKITPPTATTIPAPASSNHLPVPEQQHAPRPASPVATPASAPSSPKKQPITAPASPQPVAPKSPVKKAEEPVAAPEPIVAPKSPQRSPEPAPAAASPSPSPSPTPEEQPAVAPAEKPQRVRKDRPKREKPAAAAQAAAAPAAETPAPAAAAPAEIKQEQKAPAKVAEKPKAVAKPAPVQPPRPTTWASRLFNAAKDGPLGIAKLATGTDVEPLETAPIDTAHVNGENAAAPTAATTTETDQAARKPRSNKRPPSRTGKSGDAPSEKRERDPLYSLWVNNIPPQTTQPELNTLFGQYGNMRPIRLVAGKTYCFVDYYDVPSLENALRARPIKIHGVELSVDKKQMKQTPRTTSATSATSTTSKPASTPTPAATEDDDGFQKSTAGRSRAYKQRVASENKAAAAQQQQAQQGTSGARPTSGAKKSAPTNGAPRK